MIDGTTAYLLFVVTVMLIGGGIFILKLRKMR